MTAMYFMAIIVGAVAAPLPSMSCIALIATISMPMTYDPNIHHRRSIRLRGYDYSQAGIYFVTICSHGRECLFGDIVSGTMQLNSYGAIVVDWWNTIPEHFLGVELDGYVVMPNHMHGIVVLAARMPASPQAPILGRVVAYFKYQSTKAINQARSLPGVPVWQRNYYEHVIRSETSLQQLRESIANNPLKWDLDQLHPDYPSGR